MINNFIMRLNNESVLGSTGTILKAFSGAIPVIPFEVDYNNRIIMRIKRSFFLVFDRDPGPDPYFQENPGDNGQFPTAMNEFIVKWNEIFINLLRITLNLKFKYFTFVE